MKKEKSTISLSNICVGVAFLIVYIFLVALIFIDNGTFKNEIMNYIPDYFKPVIEEFYKRVNTNKLIRDMI